MIRFHLLGTGAGGGLPQWNCSCPNCESARYNSIPSRTQCNVAFTSTKSDHYLINCSPDILHQIRSTPAFFPSKAQRRNSPFKGVILTGADIDQILGLLSLREFTPFTIYSTPLFSTSFKTTFYSLLFLITSSFTQFLLVKRYSLQTNYDLLSIPSQVSSQTIFEL